MQGRYWPCFQVQTTDMWQACESPRQLEQADDYIRSATMLAAPNHVSIIKHAILSAVLSS